MKTWLAVAALCFCAPDASADTAQERLMSAGVLFTEIMERPETAIPADLMEKAECIVVVPRFVKALVIGGKHGYGFLTCREPGGKGWGPPAGVRIEAGAFGLQLRHATDLVLLAMSRHSMERFNDRKLKLDAADAGPIGRTSTSQNSSRGAALLAWVHSKWLFAGIPLNGATLREDEDTNRELYGKRVATGDIIKDNVPPPPGDGLREALDHYSRSRASASHE
jgi:lipid-binding SYLF domain-containing protein